MLQYRPLSLPAVRWFGQRAFLQIPGRIPEDPGIPLCGPAYHYPVTARSGQHFFRRPGTVHIPVADNRNLHRLLHLADDIPVRAAAVVLLPGAPMHRNGGHTAVLRDLCDFHRITVCLVKSLTDLNRHGLVHSFHQGGQDFPYKRRIFHQCRAFPVVHHLGHGTAHIEIQQRERSVFNPFRHFRDNFRIRTE